MICLKNRSINFGVQIKINLINTDMSIKCKFGFHTWNGCKCIGCGMIRSEKHTLVNGYCLECGLFIDERDGHEYKTVKIGNKIIMAENLAFKPTKGNFWAPEGNENNIEKYGYLYDWETAKDIAKGLNGWHLPTEEDFRFLNHYYEGDIIKVGSALNKGGRSGFDFLCCGNRLADGTFAFQNIGAGFWSSSLYKEAVSEAWMLWCSNYANTAAIIPKLCTLGFNVRLFRDSQQ